MDTRKRGPKEAQWFAYRTNLSVGGVKRPRRWAQWVGVVLVGTTCAGLALGAFFWLVTLDLDSLVQTGRGLMEATAAR